ncbi:hypothetical protein STEG23_013069 [Scotinomys teguina]
MKTVRTQMEDKENIQMVQKSRSNCQTQVLNLISFPGKAHRKGTWPSGSDEPQLLPTSQLCRYPGSISNLLGIMGIPKDELQNLANTLEGDKDLNIPRELSAEAEKELAIVEKTIREAHVDRVNPELKCILVILPPDIPPQSSGNPMEDEAECKSQTEWRTPEESPLNQLSKAHMNSQRLKQ